MAEMGLFTHVVFRAIGEPKYGDVSGEGADNPTYESAEAAGLHMLRVGNWTSFVIEQRYRAGRARDEDGDGDDSGETHEHVPRSQSTVRTVRNRDAAILRPQRRLVGLPGLSLVAEHSAHTGWDSRVPHRHGPERHPRRVGGRERGGLMGEHWTATADRVYDSEKELIAEDDYGDLWAPTPFGNYRRFTPWNPLQWVPYLHSRLANAVGWVDSGSDRG